jgi:hypothetical protein
MQTGVAVEKLLPAKCAKIKSRQDALQTTFSVFLYILYPQFLAVSKKMDIFNSHRRFRSLRGFERNGDISTVAL